LDGVEIFVAEKRVDSVVSVERHSERALVLKTAAVVRVEGRSTVEDWRPRNSITEFFLWAGCTFCHQTINVKALMEKQLLTLTHATSIRFSSTTNHTAVCVMCVLKYYGAYKLNRLYKT